MTEQAQTIVTDETAAAPAARLARFKATLKKVDPKIAIAAATAVAAVGASILISRAEKKLSSTVDADAENVVIDVDPSPEN